MENMKERNGNMKAITGVGVALIIGAAAFVALSGCLGTEENTEFDVVIVSIIPQKEMVSSIAGDNAEVVVMIPAGESPHTYEPTPSQLKKVVDADIYFKVGSGVEFELAHLDTIMEQTNSMRVVDCSEGVDVKSFDEHHSAGEHHDEDEGDHDHEDQHDEDEGDHEHDHSGGTDPHIWLSPSNMKIMADDVLEAFMEEDPDNKDEYSSNHAEYVKRLEGLINDTKEILGPYKDRGFLVYHPAWGYFGDEYELVQMSIEEDGKQPGPQGVAAMIDQARNHNISVIFVSPQFDTSSAEEIADEIDGEVVMVNPLAEDYIDNIRNVAEQMREGFKA